MHQVVDDTNTNCITLHYAVQHLTTLGCDIHAHAHAQYSS